MLSRGRCIQLMDDYRNLILIVWVALVCGLPSAIILLMALILSNL